MARSVKVRLCAMGATLALGTGCMGSQEEYDEFMAAESQQFVAGSRSALLDEDESCLEGIDATDSRGPFRYDTDRRGSVRMWVPRVPSGCRVPIVSFANGTGATCSMYGGVLQGLASHGFLATCYESANTGAGTQGMEAIEVARERHSDMVSDKIGTMGHSQGGQAAFVILAFAEDEYGADFSYAGLAMQPASGFGSQPFLRSWQSVYETIDSPMFMFSGSADILVSRSWVQRGFNALDRGVEAYNWRRSGSTHIPVPNSESVEVGIPWFRWKLLGDLEACADFYELRSSRQWSVSDEQNTQSCGEIGGGGSGSDNGSGGSDRPWWWWWG